jgi:hypothetical protein
MKTDMEAANAAKLGWTEELVGWNKLFSLLVTILSSLDQMVQLSGVGTLSDVLAAFLSGIVPKKTGATANNANTAPGTTQHYGS